MERPFEFIEYKNTQRDEFQVTEGHQPTYALIYIKQGRFILKMDGKETIVGENECVIFPDDTNFYRRVIEHIRFVYLKFRINPDCPFNIPIPFGKVRFKNQKRFLESIKKYEELAESKEIHAIYYREHLLEDILLQAYSENNSVLNQKNNPLQSSHDATVKKAVEYIQNNISSKIIISDICTAVCTNPSTLNFKFRKELNCTVWDFITELRMKKAKDYLISTTFSIGDIAKKCGFENIYYFSTAFKKAEGISPIKYRKNTRN